MAERIPVIIDTDPGVDDALALLLAGGSPELDVLAVTTVGGNSGGAVTTENARRILPVAWQDRTPPPIFRGADNAVETAEFVHGSDGLGGATALLADDGSPLYPPTAHVGHLDAAEQICDLAEGRPNDITLITLGPLTNIAEAIRRSPRAAHHLKRVVVMGGAFNTPGNVTPVSEFNIFADAEAAQTLCDSGISQLWVPVDVTQHCLMWKAHLGLEATPNRPCTGTPSRLRMAKDISEAYFQFHHRGFGAWACYLHDPVAVGAVLWPDLFRTEPRRIDVELSGKFTRGMTVADFRPAAYRPRIEPNAEVCVEIDASGFVDRFLDRLSR